MTQVKWSFVIPAYNEEESIETALFAIEEIVKPRELSYEIVVVDDGSKDLTLSRARRYANGSGHVKVVTYDKNRGKGYAVKEGFMQTEGEFVVFVDGDLDIDLNLVSKYVDALKHADIVIASKWHSDSNVDMPLTRKILSLSFSALVRLLVNVPFKDTQAGLKAMRRMAFQNIFPKLAVKRYAFDVELLAVANFYGLRIVEMPTNLTIRSTFRLKEVFKMFLDLLGIAYRLRLIRWYQRNIDKRNGLQRFVSLIFRET